MVVGFRENLRHGKVFFFTGSVAAMIMTAILLLKEAFFCVSVSTPIEVVSRGA